MFSSRWHSSGPENQRHRMSVSPTVLASHNFFAICLAYLIALNVSNTPIYLATVNGS